MQSNKALLIGNHREVTLPQPLPKGWFEVTNVVAKSDEQARYQKCYRCRYGLFVMVDVNRKRDGRFWRHASFSYKDHLPNYCDITDVKRLFFGASRKVVMIFPATSEHVNIHPYCLHLWACEDDENFIPEMSDIVEGIGRSI